MLHKQQLFSILEMMGTTMREQDLPFINPHFLIYQSISGFLCGLAGKESACNVGDLGSTPGLGRSPGEGNGYPLQYYWPGEFHVVYSPWGRKELDRTE